MRRKQRKFVVTLDVPPDATVQNVCDYIVDAVGAWKGSLYPGYIEGPDDLPDPMWELDGDSVSATAMTEPK